MKLKLLALALLVSACASGNKGKASELSAIQLIDRNGFSETISSKERLSRYNVTDFSGSQPYEKVVRHFGQKSVITTYHPNGLLAEYLETHSGRASGAYLEWHPNGHKKLEATVIEGSGDLSPDSKKSWVFDGLSKAWDSSGNVLAEIYYENGFLEGASLYYQDGHLVKRVPYLHGQIDGVIVHYSEAGEIVQQEQYRAGVLDGRCDGLYPRFDEEYSGGKLMHGYYYDFDDALIALVEDGSGTKPLFEDGRLVSTQTITGGSVEGEVKLFDEEGAVTSLWHMKSGRKDGIEEVYYPGTSTRKLLLEWKSGSLQGEVKTWYEDGSQESSSEMYKNKRHGLSFAWYQDGSIMHIEEYENGLLVKGSYMKRGEPDPVSTVENGQGVVTLFDKEGRLVEKVAYEHGHPTIG